MTFVMCELSNVHWFRRQGLIILKVTYKTVNPLTTKLAVRTTHESMTSEGSS